MTRILWNRLSSVACALALAGAAACGDDSTPAPAAPAAASLQQVLDEAVAHPDVLLPGAIGHYREPGYAPWSGSAGTGDMQDGTAIRSTDRIRAGSILKTFVATVTLQHVEDGTLSLDQTLTELLPKSVTDRVQNAEQITLRMLLNHTSGIPEWVTEQVDARLAIDPAHVWTSDEVLDMVAELPPWFPPGSSLRYSNSNYTLIGMALDRLGEDGWRAQVRRRVFDRLALRSSYLPEPGDRDIPGDYAHGYHELDGEAVDLSRIDPSMAGPSGGSALITTVQDLAQFLEALLDGQLFKRAETLEAMTTMIEAPHESGLPYGYGLGLETYEMPGGVKVIGHSGSTGGYAVMMFQLADHGGTLVTAVNTSDLFTNALNVFMPSLEVITTSAEDR